MRHLTRANKQIELGKNIELVKQSLALHFEELDKAKFYEDMRVEYDSLYKTLEIVEYVKLIDGSENYPQIVGYTYEEDCISFEDYKNETKVVTEAIEEVKEVDEDGNEVITQEYIAEVTEPLRPFVAKESYEAEIEAYLNSSSAYKEQLKTKKLEAIEDISVETNNVQYDAHTRGRADMSSIVALANFQFIQEVVKYNEELQPLYDAIYKSTLDWKGKDNLVHKVQVESVAETAIEAYKKYAEVIGAK